MNMDKATKKFQKKIKLSKKIVKSLNLFKKFKTFTIKIYIRAKFS